MGHIHSADGHALAFQMALSALSVGMGSELSKHLHSCSDARSKKQIVTDDQHLTQTEPFR